MTTQASRQWRLRIDEIAVRPRSREQVESRPDLPIVDQAADRQRLDWSIAEALAHRQLDVLDVLRVHADLKAVIRRTSIANSSPSTSAPAVAFRSIPRRAHIVRCSRVRALATAAERSRSACSRFPA